METLLAHIAELHTRTADLKKIIARTPSLDQTALRSGIYQLEAAIYVMERSAADVYRATTKKAGEV